LDFSVRETRLRLILLAIAALLLIALVVWPRNDAVEGYAYPIPPQNADNTIEVLNGTTRRGLARDGTRWLRSKGFDVVSFGNAPPADSTLILVRRGSPEIGPRLQSALRAGLVRLEPDSLRRVDATVILGSDYQPEGGLRP
jgi:hypothetical protein